MKYEGDILTLFQSHCQTGIIDNEPEIESKYNCKIVVLLL